MIQKIVFFNSTKNIFIILFYLILSCACEDKDTIQKQRMYYDIYQLLQQQPNLLSDNNQIFFKKSTFKNKNDTQTLHLNAEEWKKELIMLYDIQINKPAYLGNYDSLIETTLEGYKITYQQKNGMGFPLHTLVLHFTKEKKILFTEAFFFKTNFLYTNENRFQITWNSAPKNPTITHYKIDGYQKVIFLEKTNYLIDALCINNCF